jgi:hypothetical protein
VRDGSRDGERLLPVYLTYKDAPRKTPEFTLIPIASLRSFYVVVNNKQTRENVIQSIREVLGSWIIKMFSFSSHNENGGEAENSEEGEGEGEGGEGREKEKQRKCFENRAFLSFFQQNQLLIELKNKGKERFSTDDEEEKERIQEKMRYFAGIVLNSISLLKEMLNHLPSSLFHFEPHSTLQPTLIGNVKKVYVVLFDEYWMKFQSLQTDFDSFRMMERVMNKKETEKTGRKRDYKEEESLEWSGKDLGKSHHLINWTNLKSKTKRIVGEGGEEEKEEEKGRRKKRK